MDDRKAQKKKFFKISIIIISVLLFISMVFGLPNYLRYEYAKTFGKPHTFFSGITLGLLKDDDSGGGYDDEINLDDSNNVSIDLSSYSIPTIYVYGKFINSADRLVVILNDKVIYNGHGSNKSMNFYTRYYIEKHFVIELKDFKLNSDNKLILTTGNMTKQYIIHSK